MRIAYLLMVHREPEQVRALLRALPAESPVFVHIDRRVRRPVYRALAALQEERRFVLVRRYRCYWGRIGMVNATLALVRAALDSGEEWQYASLLSGADYPIVPNERIEQHLSQDDGAQYVAFWDMRADDNPWKRAPGRMQSDSRVDRRHVGAGRHIARFPWRRTMPYGLHPYGGSQWWTLSRAALQHVLRYSDQHPRLLRFMRGVFVPDECFVQTVLGNSPYRDAIADTDLRFVDWSRPEPPYPAVLTTADIGQLQDSGRFYARKFDIAVDPAVLGEVDRRLRR